MRALWLAALLAAAFAARAQPAPPAAAEIVSLQGRGDYREAEAAAWRPAKVKQVIAPNQFVRTTQPHSKMALLLADQTQMTLEGVSFAQVKAADAAPRRSIIEFGQGKGRFQTKTPTREFKVGTPTGLAAIRGTEWLVEVEEGRSAFTVVEGEIEISNELGAISVGADEQGILERGKAPSKRRVQDARERVQWVSSFSVDPDRYPSPGVKQAADAIRAGETSRARADLGAAIGRADAPVEAYLLASDIELYFGRGREALALLERAAARFPSDARIPGLTARAALFADDFPRARAAAAEAVSRYPGNVESRLAAGEVARLDGDYPAALVHLRSATLIAPNDWRGWHALGQLQSERAYPSSARWALTEADRVAPNNATVLSEQGLVEANAYDLPRARELLDRALVARPDDFATWTALGYARLKSGDLPGALDALLKATMLEPRSARAHIYLGVAYWQLGRFDDALKEMRAASLRDPKDPLPYQYIAMMQSDLMQPGEALAAARESVARLPFTKSLDPVATDLRGSANLGAPLAQMGLEAWAMKNAQDSFDPMWAGSHLFLADRMPGKFMANSELVQGFTTDPLAFGASNRFQSLLSRPGNYATLAVSAAMNRDEKLAEPLANVNGLFAEGRAAYFLEGGYLRYWPEDDAISLKATSITAGFGFKPRDDLGIFIYGNRLAPDFLTGNAGALLENYERFHGSARRFDAGAHYRPSPDWQLWLKGGYGSEDTRLDSRLVEASVIGPLFGEASVTHSPRSKDFGARALRRNFHGLELYAAAEWAEFESLEFLERDTVARGSAASQRSVESVLQDVRDVSKSFAVGGRWPVMPALVLELEADYTEYEKTNAITLRRDYVNQLVTASDDHSRDQWSPRAGAVVRPLPGLTLRGAWQEWLRPTSQSSLKPTSTAGIVLDDRFVLPGGQLERARIQAEWEVAPTVLLTAFGDRQEIANLYSPLTGVVNNRPDSSNLERLRNRTFSPLASVDALEGFPQIAGGELREWGVAANALVTRNMSLFVDGTWAKSEQEGPMAGRRFPFVPRERYAIGGAWFSDARWSLGAKATYRGERFTDDANLVALPAEWSGSVQAYWESRDKRWSVELLVINIGAKQFDEAVGFVVNLRF
jgi:tetratricopeptide (TPR) repeat protein